MEVKASDIPAEKLPNVRVYLNHELLSHVTAFDVDAGWVDLFVTYERAQVAAYPDKFFVFQAARSEEAPASDEEPLGSNQDGEDNKYVSNMDPADFAAIPDGDESAGADLTKLAKEHPDVIIVLGNADGDLFYAVDPLGRRLVDRKTGVVSVEGL